jgi:spore coat polysaccharide biosynthesis protein SpsF (cytidylyltransferase family)
MTYQVKSNLKHSGKSYVPGDRVEMPEGMATELVKAGVLAEIKEEEPVATAVETPLPEKKEEPKKHRKKRA